MTSLALRNLAFTILQPGIVAGLIPYYIVRAGADVLWPEIWGPYHVLGTLVFALGLVVMLLCIRGFAIEGRGTLSPADPTRELVITGLYRYSRNPMYVGVITMLIGELIFFESKWLLVYTLIVFLAFNAFILVFEEPRLKNDFGAAYRDYCLRVNRWI